MRYLIGILCVLALTVMGCSESSGGGRHPDCIGVDPDRVGERCTTLDPETGEESPGYCKDGFCALFDCTLLETGHPCAMSSCPEPGCPDPGWLQFSGVCEGDACVRRVRDCTLFEDWARCDPTPGSVGTPADLYAVCVDGSCEYYTYDCPEAEDGTPCRTSYGDPRLWGFCVEGSCEPQE